MNMVAWGGRPTLVAVVRVRRPVLPQMPVLENNKVIQGWEGGSGVSLRVFSTCSTICLEPM